MNKEHKNEKSEAAKIEEKILKFWQENKIFEKSLNKKSPNGEFVFYDGPPFATGLPHWGSLLSSVAKDVFPRYQTMKGKHVRRRWGWDTHGLPIENMIEEKLGLDDKTDIENKIGIKKFNETCRDVVLQCTDDWKDYVGRIGRWVEFDNAYKTMDNEYMESVWHFLKVADQKGLLYEGYKVLNFCPHCQTPISKAEIAMDNSYKDVKDISVTAKFELVDEPGTYLLAWTTTPWTLPGNVALAVGEDIDYVKLQEVFVLDDKGELSEGFIIIAKNFIEKINDNNLERYSIKEIQGKQYKIIKELKGSDLVGKKYKPLFDYYQKQDDLENRENGWKIYAADFVTTEDGTGIVHVAPAFGEDDFALGKKEHLPFVQHVNTDASFKKEMGDLNGIKVKQKDDYVTADIEILKLLQEKKALFSKKNITHSYPHCYRCDAPLLNYAISSWFLDLQKDKQKYLDLNKKVNWIPSNLRDGRVHNLLEGAPDWTISRNRYWATPLPFWKNKKTGELHVIGSLDELKEKTKSTNTYTLIRHGESESNVKKICSSTIGMYGDELTDNGIKQVEKTKKELKPFDFIISSPFKRTTQTAEIIGGQIIFDDRLKEIDTGKQNGKTYDREKRDEYKETSLDVKKRIMEFLYEIDSKYNNKNILIVSHGSPISYVLGFGDCGDVKNATPYSLDFAPIPHNENYELDLHRPYIDEIKLKDKNGELLERVPEVIDCWLESATMPFAEYHYPFENKELFESRRPADFISEYIAQTRTWFNYMHTVAGIMFDDISFKNVVTTGNILAEDGSKMSKSKKNYTDPIVLMNQVSADAARFYLMESSIMMAEDLEFSDSGVIEAQNKIVNVLLNSYNFYDLYKKDYNEKILPKKSKSILDIWILARLQFLIQETTIHMDGYFTPKACKEIKDFLADLTKWYVRRSRDRFKFGNKKDKEFALATLRFVLEETSKVMAPFTPFVSEYVYRKVSSNKESVHLEDWPKSDKKLLDENVIKTMADVRELISVGLQMRSESKMKVRQALASFTAPIKNIPKEYHELIFDEMNVKALIDGELKLDTELTPELIAEGSMRELLRAIQKMRKDAGLDAHDTINLVIQTSTEGQKLIEKFSPEIKKTAGITEFNFTHNDGDEIKVAELIFIIAIEK